MDCGLTYDVVDTPPPQENCEWPSPEDFHEHEEIKKCGDIIPGTYKVLEFFNQGGNSYGPSVVLRLKHKEGSIFSVWAPSSLLFAM